jgi:hypothetical protein
LGSVNNQYTHTHKRPYSQNRHQLWVSTCRTKPIMHIYISTIRSSIDTFDDGWFVCRHLRFYHSSVAGWLASWLGWLVGFWRQRCVDSHLYYMLPCRKCINFPAAEMFVEQHFSMYFTNMLMRQCILYTVPWLQNRIVVVVVVVVCM